MFYCVEMDIRNIAEHFDFQSGGVAVRDQNKGHINNTFIVNCENGECFIVQCINKGVFKHPEEVMHNVVSVTDHIRQKLVAKGGDAENGAMRFLTDYLCGDTYFRTHYPK